ncbi:hypothetical protein E2C01_101804 [Portunus trituberculatus]|uniref:Uncharacterized protein n=1 Tax=Portunus trituberculatus TaxID=210409 RepID=A0A5B7KMT5_PORTR|nr:hypothetical protein [Portunus trituberculatus]
MKRRRQETLKKRKISHKSKLKLRVLFHRRQEGGSVQVQTKLAFLEHQEAALVSKRAGMQGRQGVQGCITVLTL